MAVDVQLTSGANNGKFMFYENIEPLDAARHARLGMNETGRQYGFVSQTHFVPLQVGEFSNAAVFFPIIFAGDQRSPLAVMGLRAGQNLFIDGDGAPVTGLYVPAFIRRYPFVTVRDVRTEQMVVCIDRGFERFTEDNPDTPLFADGRPTAFTERCIQFCGGFDADSRNTAFFVDLLTRMDLFEPRQATFTPTLTDGSAGQPVVVAEFIAVSEKKLNALPSSDLAELNHHGALKQVYAHLISLAGWDRLIQEGLAREAAGA